jgi:fructokinase
VSSTPQFDVTSLGELVIDLVPIPNVSGLAYAAKPGGAPANVAAGVARLGGRAAMVGNVGDDPFGRDALRALVEAGVSADTVAVSKVHKTPLAVVSYSGDVDVSYSFFRENSADINLVLNDLALERIAASKVLHIGTFLLATPVSGEAQRRAVSHARGSGVAVSLDVNFRETFWNDMTAMVAAGREMIGQATFLKLSRNELFQVTGIDNVQHAARSLWHEGLALMAVTDGTNGSDLFTALERVSVPAFAVDIVDTIGCGDAFAAALLAWIVEMGSDRLHSNALYEAGLRASAAGALLATRQGALESMPTQQQINDLIAGRSATPEISPAASSVA